MAALSTVLLFKVLLCFDSREGERRRRSPLFFSSFFLIKKKKSHAKRRCFSGFNGNSNRFVTELCIDKN